MSGLKVRGSILFIEFSTQSFVVCTRQLSENNKTVDLADTSQEGNLVQSSSRSWNLAEQCEAGSTRGDEFCPKQTQDDDDSNTELIIIIGVVIGVVLLFIIILCIVLYIRNTSSSVFGVYNPSSQEQTQEQQMKPAFTLPIPEKLI